MAVSTGAAAADTARDLYERHAPQVYSLCLRRLGSREEAEDAAQTVFLNAFGALRRGSQPRFERAWLRKIAENVCLDRRARALPTRNLDSLEEVLASPEREPSQIAALEQALAGLPETQRRAIVLREWQGLSYREIAAELQVSESAAEAVAFRARRTLVERLGGMRANLSLLGWFKSALGGSAAALKLAAVASVVVVGAGSAGAAYVVTRAEPAPSREPASPSPAPSPKTPTAEAGPPSPASSAPGGTRAAPRPGAQLRDGAAAAVTETPVADGRPTTLAERPSAQPRAGSQSAAPPSSGVTKPVDLPVEAPELPVDLPPLPPVEVPELPAVETPPLPAVETPPLPAVEVPPLPPVETPPLPAAETPPLPPLLP